MNYKIVLTVLNEDGATLKTVETIEAEIFIVVSKAHKILDDLEAEFLANNQ